MPVRHPDFDRIAWQTFILGIVERMGARVIGPDEVRTKLGLTKRAPA